jgi:predicted metal-dependent phosphoesterase TrpH
MAGRCISADADVLRDYVQTAQARGLGVLGITDHNTIRNVKAAVQAAEGSSLLVLPGIEVSTHEGHLLALFAPTAVDRRSRRSIHLGSIRSRRRGQKCSLSPDGAL